MRTTWAGGGTEYLYFGLVCFCYGWYCDKRVVSIQGKCIPTKYQYYITVEAGLHHILTACSALTGLCKSRKSNYLTQKAIDNYAEYIRSMYLSLGSMQ